MGRPIFSLQMLQFLGMAQLSLLLHLFREKIGSTSYEWKDTDSCFGYFNQ